MGAPANLPETKDVKGAPKAKPEELPISAGMPFKSQHNVVGVLLIGLYRDQTQACRISQKSAVGGTLTHDVAEIMLGKKAKITHQKIFFNP